MKNKKLVLAARPNPAISTEIFRLEEKQLSSLSDGQLLIKNHYLSVDPAMRGWVTDMPNYIPPVEIGTVMRSFAVGEVVESKHSDYAVGDFVYGLFGWQEFAVSDGFDVERKVNPDDGPLSINLHVLGMTGATAWFGLTEIGDPKHGETVVVSTAAGAVGSMVGQIAKARGCRTVGITGSDEKAVRCLNEFGYDAVLNYKTATDLAGDLTKACPDGVDVYFDNVSGPITDAVMNQFNIGARMTVCGVIGISPEHVNGPRVSRTMLVKRAKMQGFLIFDHMHRLSEAVAGLLPLYKAGKLSFSEEIFEGLSSAPRGLESLLAGTNQGKVIVKL
ncbi:alcohol dehydrogenase [Kiloniella spongiae]|uniref:Alcohol dehydrogenase n=1 Tax=Kiloniella spongiae TaxID=1489064 RepID=A0A0H2M9V4_9PROT|nr:NADP-dependent oxidoreductase [Kiloniella spongiae]KLN59324.1 alcohol dehydrogenase [Kiloniella spongiae]